MRTHVEEQGHTTRSGPDALPTRAPSAAPGIGEAPVTANSPAVTAPLVLVCTSNRTAGAGLVAALLEREVAAEVVRRPTVLTERVAREHPAAVVVDLAVRDGRQLGLAILGVLHRQSPEVVPVVLAEQRSFVDRVAVARLGGRLLLPLSAPPSELAESIATLLLQVNASNGARVLAVDDDRVVLTVLSSLLARRGLRVETLTDTRRVWDALDELHPDLLLLDVHMPHVDGIELCRVIRSDPTRANLPVLFLTAETDPEALRTVFQAGADDYVTKPIVELELISRIENRLARARLQRQLAETDPLTGLATRRKSSEWLERTFRLSARFGQPVSFALVDLDHFKRVNDQYGHAMGDSVLRRLADVLQRAFRGEDVVARWGGEEFVVGMYGMSKRDGVRRLGDVQRAFSVETFQLPPGHPFRRPGAASAESDRFNVSFSAGVAEYPSDGTDLMSLYLAADQAMYRAKAAGRGQVHPANVSRS